MSEQQAGIDGADSTTLLRGLCAPGIAGIHPIWALPLPHHRGAMPHLGKSHGIAVLTERFALGAETFEIVVKGRLSSTLIAAIDGFEVSHCDDGMTHLVGWVPDQARLHSVLELLRDLNIELASVNPMPPHDPGSYEHKGGTNKGKSNG